jgi:hypothetical protein
MVKHIVKWQRNLFVRRDIIFQQGLNGNEYIMLESDLCGMENENEKILLVSCVFLIRMELDENIIEHILRVYLCILIPQ